MAILPRYTGYQVWNKQSKAEVLVDPHNVGLGTRTMMRWNPREEWVSSQEPAHPAIVGIGDFERARDTRAVRGTRRIYLLPGLLCCDLCGRRMEGAWNNGRANYRWSVATVTAVVVRRMGRSTLYPWTVVVVNAGFSVAGNALHAYAGSSLTLPHTVAMSVSAIPALNLALSVHLLVTLVDSLADVLNRCAECEQVGDGCGTPSIDSLDDQQRIAATSESPVPTPHRSGTVTGIESDSVVVNLANPYPDGIDSGECRRDATERPLDRELRREAWRWAQQHPRPGGSLVSGEELARVFDRSARWGRLVKREGAAGEFD